MYGNVRPEIVRVAEQTVVNLKELESRIEVLKNDLAALCVQVGHPEAARLAATPVQWLGSAGLSTGLGANVGALGINPMQIGQQPFGQQPFGQQPFGQQTPFSGLGSAPFAPASISPFANPFATASPFGTSPFANPFSAFSSFPSALTQTQLPYNQGTPLTQIR